MRKFNLDIRGCKKKKIQSKQSYTVAKAIVLFFYWSEYMSQIAGSKIENLFFLLNLSLLKYSSSWSLPMISGEEESKSWINVYAHPAFWYNSSAMKFFNHNLPSFGSAIVTCFDGVAGSGISVNGKIFSYVSFVASLEKEL